MLRWPLVQSLRLAVINGRWGYMSRSRINNVKLTYGLNKQSQIRLLTSLLIRWNNHYELLGISNRLADTEEIKAAYFRKSKDYHPDLYPNDRYKHQKFVKLNEAYKILADPISRKAYDFALNGRLNYVSSYNAHNLRNESYQYDNVYPSSNIRIFKTKNYIVVLCLCGLCLISGILHYGLAKVAEKYLRETAEKSSQRISAVYTQVTETARKNGTHKQLESFLEQHRDAAIANKDSAAEQVATSLLQKVKKRKKPSNDELK